MGKFQNLDPTSDCLRSVCIYSGIFWTYVTSIHSTFIYLCVLAHSHHSARVCMCANTHRLNLKDQELCCFLCLHRKEKNKWKCSFRMHVLHNQLPALWFQPSFPKHWGNNNLWNHHLDYLMSSWFQNGCFLALETLLSDGNKSHPIKSN